MHNIDGTNGGLITKSNFFQTTSEERNYTKEKGKVQKITNITYKRKN